MTLASERGRIGGDDLKKLERIRLAALKSFATDGAAATSLRSVAADAGVSLGLVQHRFATKAGLIQAVDDYVMSVVIEMVSRPVSAHPEDSMADMGSRITNLLLEHPDVVDHFGRALIDGSPLGTTIRDTLAAFGTARSTYRRETGEARADIDVTSAALDSLVLALGTLSSCAATSSGQVPGAFSTPAQLDRWQQFVDTLLREGLFPRGSDTGS